MTIQKLNRLAKEDYLGIIDRILKSDYKVLGPEDGDRVIMLKGTKANSHYWVISKLVPLSVDIVYVPSLKSHFAFANNTEKDKYTKIDDQIDYKEIYVMTGILDKYGGFEGPSNGWFTLLNKYRLERDRVAIQVSEEHFKKFGGTMVRKGYLPVTYKDEAPEGSLNSFDDLIKTL